MDGTPVIDQLRAFAEKLTATAEKPKAARKPRKTAKQKLTPMPEPEPRDPVVSLPASPPPPPVKKPKAKSKPRPPKGVTVKKAPEDLIPLTDSLARARPTPKSLAAHHYQRKLAAHYAPHILPATLQAIKDAVEAGNMHAVKAALELYEMVQTDKRISIVNDNRSVSIDARGGAGDSRGSDNRRSFESVARMLEEAREKRITDGNPLAARIIEGELSETPEGISK